MAIFHLSVKAVQRSSGRSSTAAAAYRAADKLHDERTGETHDYTKKKGVLFSTILVPQGESVPSRSALWNAAEAAEKRKDARTAREYEVALPAELSPGARQALAESFARSLVERYSCAVDLCIHEPSRGGDQRNWHAHLLTTTRIFTGGQLGAKTDIELSDVARKKKGLSRSADEITALRKELAELTNRALQAAGLDERVDHRSFEAQGREDEPTIHLGPAATAMERKGEQTVKAEINRAILVDREEHAAVRKQRRAFASFLRREQRCLVGTGPEGKQQTAKAFLEAFDQERTDAGRQAVQDAARAQVEQRQTYVECVESSFGLSQERRAQLLALYDQMPSVEDRQEVLASVRTFVGGQLSKAHLGVDLQEPEPRVDQAPDQNLEEDESTGPTPW